MMGSNICELRAEGSPDVVLLNLFPDQLAGGELQQQHAEVGAAQVQRQEHALLCQVAQTPQCAPHNICTGVCHEST